MNLLEHYSRSRIFSSEELYTWRTYLQEEFTIKGDKRITNREDCKYETLSTVFHFRISGLIKVSLLDHFLLLVFTAFSSHFPLLCYHLALSSRFLLLVFTFQLTFFFFFFGLTVFLCSHVIGFSSHLFCFQMVRLPLNFYEFCVHVRVKIHCSHLPSKFLFFFFHYFHQQQKIYIFSFFFSPSNAIPIVKKKKKM